MNSTSRQPCHGLAACAGIGQRCEPQQETAGEEEGEGGRGATDTVVTQLSVGVRDYADTRR